MWDQKKFDIAVQGNYHKFNSNPGLKEFLLNTRDRVLVEASPVDAIWGIGLSADHPDIESPEIWPGQNLLGFALMAARELLKT
jgi:ribA/ribD-fused uncharacterized protein